MLYERKPNRLRDFDYSTENLYFVTSCVQDRTCSFGEIKDGTMYLNKYGEIVEKQWFWLETQYPYVKLHAFIVMPNHVHGIIEINRNAISSFTGVGMGRDPSLRPYPNIKIKSLSELMGAYKTTSSKRIHLAGLSDFAWQKSFYDHIIRNKKVFMNISEYIQNNPGNWKEDKIDDIIPL